MSTKNNIRPDPAEIARALDILVEPESVCELRVLKTGKTRTVRGYFDNIDAAVEAAAAWSGQAPAVYLTLNPVNPALLARAANRLEPYAENSALDPDIVRRRWLLIDIDPDRPSGISSSDAEHEAAIAAARAVYQWLKFRGWPAPVVADSGNGAHLLYRVDMPNDEESRDLFKAALQALAARFNDGVVSVDQTVFNAARISKLYGTAACKGDDTPDRPHRLSRILTAPDDGLALVSVDQLRSLAKESPEPEPKSAPKSHARGRESSADFFGSVNDRAMQNLAAWVPALFPAAKAYQGGYRVKSKDLHRNLEEDLSILSTGIVDFGVADQGDSKEGRRTPIDLVIEWGSAGDAVEAAQWLCNQLGIDPESMGWRKSAPKSRAPVEKPEPAPVLDLVEIKSRRLAFEKQIEATEDIEELSVVIAPAIQGCELLPVQTRSRLLKMIAKKVGLSPVELAKSLRPPKEDAAEPEPIEDDHLIESLNQRYAVVKIGGRACIMSQDYDPGLERPMLSFLGRNDFELLHCNKKVGLGRHAVTLGQHWLESPRRRQYEGVIFSPGKNVDGYYNLFQGFGVEPKTGSYGRFAEFVHNIICAGNDDLFEYVWCWLAHLFQRPAELPGTAIVLRSVEQGTGKNTFVETIGKLVGRQHFIQLASMHQVTGRFSGHLADLLLVHANEAIWGGDKNAEGVLKGMITDAMETIERKHQDAFSVPNFKRVMISTNNEWPIARDAHDRRFVVCDVSPMHQRDRAYFGAIHEELNNGGYEALMQALLEVDISDWSPAAVPESLQELGWDIKIRSGSSVLKWYFQCLQAGYRVPGDPDIDQWPSEPIKKDHFHYSYLKWCERLREMHPLHMTQFSRELQSWGAKIGRPRFGGVQTPCFLLPELTAAREMFARVVGIPMEVWSTDYFDE